MRIIPVSKRQGVRTRTHAAASAIRYRRSRSMTTVAASPRARARSTTCSRPSCATPPSGAPHLMSYLHKVPFAEFGVPDYYPEATRKMGDIEDPNLIYPVGEQHVHPHLSGPPGGPELLHRHRARHRHARRLIEEMEYRLLDFVEILADANTPEEKTEVMLKAIEDSCDIVDHATTRPSEANGRATRRRPRPTRQTPRPRRRRRRARAASSSCRSAAAAAAAAQGRQAQVHRRRHREPAATW